MKQSVKKSGKKYAKMKEIRDITNLCLHHHRQDSQVLDG